MLTKRTEIPSICAITGLNRKKRKNVSFMIMKKRFNKLTKAVQEQVESEYHRMKPADFDEQMGRAQRHSPETIRLPKHLIVVLKAMAELEGEKHYQAMIRKWIEERLQQEARLAMKYSKLPLSELVAVLKRQTIDKASV